MTPSARKLVAGKGEEPPVRGEKQNLIRGFRRDDEALGVTFLVLDLRGVLDPALDGADPAPL